MIETTTIAANPGMTHFEGDDCPGGHAIKTCPKCKLPYDIDTGFGYRLINEKIRPQSWCRKCRSSKIDKTGITITTSKDQVNELYRKYYPGDVAGQQNKRSWRFMVQKLAKKLGNELAFDEAARTLFNTQEAA